MVNFQEAIAYLLSNEGGVFEDAQTGECSNHGISLKWLRTIRPSATADDIRHMTTDQASALYKQYWWDGGKFDLIGSDRVATKLFDACVNCGAQTAVEIFQRTLNEPLTEHDPKVTVDGFIGAQVAAAVAAECAIQGGERDLLDSFCFNLIQHYEAIVAANPIDKKFLPAWEARSEKMPPEEK